MRFLAAAVFALFLSVPSTARAGGFGIGGFGLEFPANFTMKLGFGYLGEMGGWIDLELQPQRLAKIGPTLSPGQQSRAFGLRMGGFLLGSEDFGAGIGFNIEGLFTGLPATVRVDPVGYWHGAVSGEAVFGLMPGGSRAPFLAMLHLGYGLAPDDKTRTYGELNVIVPFRVGGLIWGVTGGLLVSSFTLANVPLVTFTPSLTFLVVPG